VVTITVRSLILATPVTKHLQFTLFPRGEESIIQPTVSNETYFKLSPTRTSCKPSKSYFSVTEPVLQNIEVRSNYTPTVENFKSDCSDEIIGKKVVTLCAGISAQ